MVMSRSRPMASSFAVAGLLAACSATGTPSELIATASPTAASSPEAPQTIRPTASPSRTPSFSVQTYPVPAGSHPHDVAPAADGGVWYTAQGSGELGWLDPADGEVREVSLGAGSAPHGVIVGPEDAPWITDGEIGRAHV